jgi:uncharacterized protein YcgI (DUF1989 family)
LAECGLTLEDVYSPASINLFANVRIRSNGYGGIKVSPQLARKDDLVDFRAEMDVPVVVSACPDDISAMNGHSCKSVGVQIIE